MTVIFISILYSTTKTEAHTVFAKVIDGDTKYALSLKRKVCLLQVSDSKYKKRNIPIHSCHFTVSQRRTDHVKSVRLQPCPKPLYEVVLVSKVCILFHIKPFSAYIKYSVQLPFTF